MSKNNNQIISTLAEELKVLSFKQDLKLAKAANDNFCNQRVRLKEQITKNLEDLIFALIMSDSEDYSEIKYFADVLEFKTKAGEDDKFFII
jgi:hypothetical protein